MESFKIRMFDSAEKLAEILGVSYTFDDQSKEVIIGGKRISTIGWDSNDNPIVGVRAVAEMLGYDYFYHSDTNTLEIKSPPCE